MPSKQIRREVGRYKTRRDSVVNRLSSNEAREVVSGIHVSSDSPLVNGIDLPDNFLQQSQRRRSDIADFEKCFSGSSLVDLTPEVFIARNASATFTVFDNNSKERTDVPFEVKGNQMFVNGKGFTTDSSHPTEANSSQKLLCDNVSRNNVLRYNVEINETKRKTLDEEEEEEETLEPMNKFSNTSELNQVKRNIDNKLMQQPVTPDRVKFVVPKHENFSEDLNENYCFHTSTENITTSRYNTLNTGEDVPEVNHACAVGLSIDSILSTRQVGSSVATGADRDDDKLNETPGEHILHRESDHKNQRQTAKPESKEIYIKSRHLPREEWSIFKLGYYPSFFDPKENRRVYLRKRLRSLAKIKKDEKNAEERLFVVEEGVTPGFLAAS